MSLNKIIFSTALLLSCAVKAAPEQFDQLVQQIESGQRYFFSLADYQTALAELDAALPQNDTERQHRLDRLRCLLGYADNPDAGVAYSDNKIQQAKQRNDQAALADYYVCRYYLFSQTGDSNLATQSAQQAHDAATASENPLSIAISLALLGNLAS